MDFPKVQPTQMDHGDRRLVYNEGVLNSTPNVLETRGVFMQQPAMTKSIPPVQPRISAALTRKMLFDRLTSEDMSLIGFHLPDGGTGRAVKDGDGYRFIGEGK